MAGITAVDWTNEALSTAIVPLQQLKHLTVAAQGQPIWKSNNPEKFSGNGWLMQNARSHAMRGGSRFTNLKNSFGIYLFHINGTGSTKFLHVLVTNPNPNTIQVSGKGSLLNNLSFPLPPPATRRGKGLCYQVARDWLEDKQRIKFNNVSIQTGKAFQIASLQLNNNNMADGRFELTASDGVFVYTVVTSTNNLNDAITASQGNPASGDIRSPATNTFGREGGICSHSLWQGTTDIEVPAAPAHLGLCLNTSNKFQAFLQDQTSDYLMRLADSADRSYANFGHQYDITLTLKNSANVTRQVRLSFAANDPSAPVGSLYNGPIRLNDRIIDILNTPTDLKDTLETLAIPPNAATNIRLQFYIPGLITIGQQLILESI